MTHLPRVSITSLSLVSGHVCSVALPEGPQYPQVQVLRIDNQYICLGGWSKALRLLGLWAGVEEVVCSIRQHTSAYVSIRQYTSAYVSIRQSRIEGWCGGGGSL